jgi:hypothetical protein
VITLGSIKTFLSFLMVLTALSVHVMFERRLLRVINMLTHIFFGTQSSLSSHDILNLLIIHFINEVLILDIVRILILHCFELFVFESVFCRIVWVKESSILLNSVSTHPIFGIVYL